MMAARTLLLICLGLVLEYTKAAVYNPCDGVQQFFFDPEDCSKYYQCDGHRVFHMNCPGGLHWDVKITGCEFPENAQCEASEDVNNPCDGVQQFFPDPLDCSKYYHCDGRRAYHMDCPGKLQWDVKINGCEYPEIARCTGISKTTNRPYETTTESYSTTTRQPYTSTTTVYQKTTPKQERSSTRRRCVSTTTRVATSSP